MSVREVMGASIGGYYEKLGETMRKMVGLLLVVVGAVSCANVVVTKTSDSAYESGLRFYRPQLYLLVTSDADGKTQTAVVPLPDKSQEYVAQAIPGFGNAELKVTLEGGWNLTSIGATVDSKIPETISALGSLIGAVTPGIAEGQPVGPGLYRIDFGEDGHVFQLTRIPVVQSQQ